MQNELEILEFKFCKESESRRLCLWFREMPFVYLHANILRIKKLFLIVFLTIVLFPVTMMLYFF